MSEEYMILMDRLDALFDQVNRHDWDVPLWMRLELRKVSQQYARINKLLRTPEKP